MIQENSSFEKKHFIPKPVGAVFFAAACFLIVSAGTAVSAASHRTVYGGIDYSPVYDYSYYVKRHPNVKRVLKNNEFKILEFYIYNGYPKKEKACSTADDAAFARVQKARIAKFLRMSKTSGKTSQIIVVCDHELSLWNKQKDGSWKRQLRYYCGYGKNGLSSDRHEGDKTTPVGSFPILHAFGKGDNPGTKMKWKEITPYSYWSGEYDSYNTWVESRYRISGEHLADYYQYEYAMAIGFNRNPVVHGKGSAIFLHCKSSSRWYTAGCVSLKKADMKKLLLSCKNGTYIVIVPRDSLIKKY